MTARHWLGGAVLLVAVAAIVAAGCDTGGVGGGGGKRRKKGGGNQGTIPVDPWSIAVADFNDDGRPDVAAANPEDHTVSVLLNETPPAGAFTFAPPVDFPTVDTPARGGGPLVVAADDLNGDGLPDFATVDLANETAAIFLNTTQPGDTVPSFAPRLDLILPFHAGSVEIALADLNGDARVDVAVQGRVITSVFLNETLAGDLVPAFGDRFEFTNGKTSTGPSSGWFAIAAADLDGDGRADLVALDPVPASSPSDGSVHVLRNTTPAGATTPSFDPPQDLGLHAGETLAAGDLNEDGRPDLVVVSNEHVDSGPTALRTLVNTTPGPGSKPTFAAGPVLADTGGVLALGDADGDGTIDVLTSGPRLRLFPNATPAGAPTLTFEPLIEGVDEIPNTYSIRLADLNADQEPEVLVAVDDQPLIEIHEVPTP